MVRGVYLMNISAIMIVIGTLVGLLLMLGIAVDIFFDWIERK
jgi:hypothetical protein